MPGPANWKSLLDRLERAGTGIKHVHGVVVTHSHPDHFGGAGKVRVETGAKVISSTTFRTWFDPSPDVQEDPESVAAEALEAGAADEEIKRPPKVKDPPTPWGGQHPAPP